MKCLIVQRPPYYIYVLSLVFTYSVIVIIIILLFLVYLTTPAVDQII
jgi:hypothetical protein